MVKHDGDPALVSREDGGMVCVVGVGSVGLTAVKWCLERGLDVRAFERRNECGGVWKHGSAPSHSPAYDSLFTNSSRTLMNLSDFPFPFKTKRQFPHHTEVFRRATARRRVQAECHAKL